MAEVDTVICTIYEPSYVTLHQSLKEGGLKPMSRWTNEDDALQLTGPNMD